MMVPAIPKLLARLLRKGNRQSIIKQDFCLLNPVRIAAVKYRAHCQNNQLCSNNKKKNVTKKFHHYLTDFILLRVLIKILFPEVAFEVRKVKLVLSTLHYSFINFLLLYEIFKAFLLEETSEVQKAKQDSSTHLMYSHYTDRSYPILPYLQFTLKGLSHGQMHSGHRPFLSSLFVMQHLPRQTHSAGRFL